MFADLQNAKLVSLELEIKKKDVVINEKDNKLKVATIEVTDLPEELDEANKAIAEKEEALDIALARGNYVEEEKGLLQHKIKLYRAAINKLRNKKEEDKEEPSDDIKG